MRTLRLGFALLLTPFATLAALIARTMLSDPALRTSPAWLVRDSVEGFSAVEALALLAVGMAARALGGRGSSTFRSVEGLAPAVAFATLAGVSLVDSMRGGSHSLLGLEWLVYAFFGGIIWLGIRLAGLMAAKL
ncbi:MAG: hypothetical protein M5U13_13520 [Thermoanaerobaculia bacterium]|nr:hypothetical protein [Thermoanaerobaculia bacterium]